MEIRSILTVLDGSERCELALKASITLANYFSAHVDVLRVEPMVAPAMMTMGIGIAGMTDALIVNRIEAANQEQTGFARRMFDLYCVQAGLNVIDPDTEDISGGPSFSWHLVSGHDGPEIARRGRLCDLIVMARAAEDQGGADSTLLEAALFDTGRPVFISGSSPDTFSGRNITIAWDGSREAAHSIGLAMPFLTRARHVRILTAGAEMSGEDPQALVRYLRRQGVESDAKSIVCGKQEIAGVLLDEAGSSGSDLLVMGAYGHDALSEYLFGGVTRTILENATIPVAIAH